MSIESVYKAYVREIKNEDDLDKLSTDAVLLISSVGKEATVAALGPLSAELKQRGGWVQLGRYEDYAVEWLSDSGKFSSTRLFHDINPVRRFFTRIKDALLHLRLASNADYLCTRLNSLSITLAQGAAEPTAEILPVQATASNPAQAVGNFPSVDMARNAEASPTTLLLAKNKRAGMILLQKERRRMVERGGGGIQFTQTGESYSWSYRETDKERGLRQKLGDKREALKQAEREAANYIQIHGQGLVGKADLKKAIDDVYVQMSQAQLKLVEEYEGLLREHIKLEGRGVFTCEYIPGSSRSNIEPCAAEIGEMLNYLGKEQGKS